MKSNAARPAMEGAGRPAADHAEGPVHLELLVIAQRRQQPGDPHDAREPHLARHDG